MTSTQEYCDVEYHQTLFPREVQALADSHGYAPYDFDFGDNGLIGTFFALAGLEDHTMQGGIILSSVPNRWRSAWIKVTDIHMARTYSVGISPPSISTMISTSTYPKASIGEYYQKSIMLLSSSMLVSIPLTGFIRRRLCTL